MAGGSSDSGAALTEPNNDDLIGCGISLAAALCAALAIIYIKKLADQVHCTL